MVGEAHEYSFLDVKLQGILRKTAAEGQTANLASLKEKSDEEEKGSAGILDGNKKSADGKGEEWIASLLDNKPSSSINGSIGQSHHNSICRASANWDSVHRIRRLFLVGSVSLLLSR